jgi:hypothetical protein
VVRSQNDSSFVFTALGDKARKTWVTTGKKNSSFIEIKTGLADEDLVITTGLDQISDEQEIQIIYSGEMTIK